MTDSLSPKLVALAFLFGGLLLLTVASLGSDLPPLLMDLDPHSAESAQIELAVMVGGVSMGLALMGLGAWRGLQISQDRSAEYGPFVEPLTRLSGEFGARLEQHPTEGLMFRSQYHAAALEVLVQPLEPTRLCLLLAAPAQQRLMVLAAHGAGSDLDDAEWRLVGRRNAWVLRAPMPALARPLLDDAELAQHLDEVCAFPELVGVRHDQDGVQVLASGMEPERVVDFLRTALTVARVLQARNGV